MLLNYDRNKELYIIGSSLPTMEFKEWIANDDTGVINTVNHDEVKDLPDNSQCIIGFQTLKHRVKFLKELENLTLHWPTYIHPTAFVHNISLIGHGCVLTPLSSVGYNVKLDNFCLVGQSVTIGHGSSLGYNTVIAPGTTIAGSTCIGDRVYFGQNSSVKDHLTICNDTNFFMNSIVTKNIDLPGTYYGNRKTLAHAQH